MKKKILIALAAVAVVLVCLFCFVHIWRPATCTEPRKCSICGAERGEPLGHDFTQPTCTQASVCTVCGAEGDPATGHEWLSAAQGYRICLVCGAEEGERYDYENEINCAHVALYNVGSDYMVYSAGADERCYPASTTKLVTACLALTYLDPSQVITVGNEALLVGANSSTAGLIIGYRLTVEDLLCALLVPSGNDAAYVLAYNVAVTAAGGQMSRSEYIEYFVQLMNDFAAEAGALDTHFENPDGYDDADHYTTASDMIKLAKKALEYPLIREICAMTNVSRTIASGQQLSWSSSNRLLFSSSGYYYQYATGLKTGSTPAAGSCLVATAQKGEEEYIAVIMGCASDADRYTAARKLFASVLGE